VVVSRTPLADILPLQRTTKDEHAMMAAFEGPTLAKLGLLKMDILGLANLSIVAEALKFIEQTTGKLINLADIPLNDPRVFESLGRGETTNVFQLESTGMTRYLMQLKPTRVDDLYAMVALYRPGPLEQIPVYIHNKNNPRDIKYIHPILKPILEDTYGVIVYQEQIMQLLQAIAGYTLGNAYIVLKAIGKKDRQLMAAEEPRFKEGCFKQGLTRDQADTLWDLIQPFAGYSFNRPHATLYGLLSYQTAWLKTNYPTEYMAAVLTASAGQIEDVAKSVAESSRLGVAVLPADVNRSQVGFTIERLPDGTLPEYSHRLGVRFGLSAIRNVGEGPLAVILKAREAAGPFRSLEDFCDRVDRSALNKRVLESLIKCGSVDTLPGTRRQKLAILDQALAAGIEAQRAREAGQSSMFDLLGGGGASSTVQSIPLPIINESQQDHKEQLAWEKELLGMYVSDHPIARAMDGLDMTGITSIGQISEELNGQQLTFVGMLSQVRRMTTKKGDSMLVAMFEDIEASIEVVVFPKSYEKYRDLLVDDALLRMVAKVDKSRRDDKMQLMLESVTVLEASSAPASTPEPDLAMDLEGITDQAPAALPELSPDDVPHPADLGGAPPQEQRMPATPMAPEQTVSIIRPRAKVGANGNGNGNGHSNGNGNGNGHASAAQGSAQSLRLYFPRTSDFDADVRLMEQVDRLLRQSAGESEVIIHMPSATGVVLLKPRHKVNCDTTLVGALHQVLDAQSVVVS
jgi:DNA polymerase-3 subunit alpha